MIPLLFIMTCVLKICAEERTDNRVVEFEVSARKLDKKVSITTVYLNYV